MMQTIIDNWYIIGFLISLIAYYIYSIRKPNANAVIDETKFYMLLGLIFFVAIVIHKWFFSSHLFFFIAMVIFIPLWAFVIKYLLSRDDVYVMESRILGDEFFDIKRVEKITVDETSQRLLVMPREIYDSKRHVGELHYGLWAGSPRIKFTDYYDDVNGIFYHPPIQQLHNFTFYAIKGYWLKMKKDLPGIIDRNTVFTLLNDWQLAFKMDAIKTNVDEHLKTIAWQHEHIPFSMPDSLETLYNKAKKDKRRDIDISEKREKPETPASDNKPGNTETAGDAK